MFTWHDLCSERYCTVVIAAKQNNGVGKREGHPSRVIPFRHAVIVFDKYVDCEGLELVDILSFINIELETNAKNNLMMRRAGLSFIIGRHLIV